MSSHESSNPKHPGTGLAIVATLGATVTYLPFAWYFGAEPGVLAVLATGMACVLPILMGRLLPETLREGTAGLLLSTGARMAFVFAVCVVAKEGWPSLTFPSFFLWVVLVYLTLLAVDTVVLLRSLPLSRRISS